MYHSVVLLMLHQPKHHKLLMMNLLQELGGSRMHYNFPRVGGVKRDLPHGFAQRARAKVSLFLNRIQEYEALGVWQFDHGEGTIRITMHED